VFHNLCLLKEFLKCVADAKFDIHALKRSVLNKRNVFLFPQPDVLQRRRTGKPLIDGIDQSGPQLIAPPPAGGNTVDLRPTRPSHKMAGLKDQER